MNAQNTGKLQVLKTPEDDEVKRAEAIAEKAKNEFVAAEKELTRLQQVADAAEEAAIQAARDFESTPTGESSAEKFVTEQVLKNARSEVNVFRTSVFSKADTRRAQAIGDLEAAKRRVVERAAIKRLTDALSELERAIYVVDEALMNASKNGCTPVNVLNNFAHRLNSELGMIRGGIISPNEDPVRFRALTDRRLLELKILRPVHGGIHGRVLSPETSTEGPTAA